MATGLPNDINARHHQSFQYVGSVVAQRVGVFNSSGTQVDTFGGTSAAVYVDDADWTATSSSHSLSGGIYQSTPGSVTDGDTGPFRMDANGAIHINDGGNTITVDGTVTANLSATDNAVLDSIDSATTAIQTAVEILDNAISGSEMQVDIVSGGGGGTEYTEDVATANPIVGTATLMERDDALTTVTPAEADWIGMRGTAEGALWTQDFNSDAILADTTAIKTAVETLDNAISGSEMQVDIVSANVTNAGTFAVQVDGSALTALQLIDNIVSVDDAAFSLGSGSGVMMMGFAGTQSVNANDSAALACDTDGALHISDGGNSITIDGTVTADLGATDNAVLDAIAASLALLDNSISAGNELQVDVVGSLPAGSAAIGKLAANSGVDIGDVDVTSITNDSINGPESSTGPSVDSYTQVAINLTTGANQVLASSAANKQIWVYGYTFTCGDADGQTVSFQDEDDTALSGIMEFAQYGGAAVSPSGNFAMPIWKLATDKDLEVDITGGDVDGWISVAVVDVS